MLPAGELTVRTARAADHGQRAHHRGHGARLLCSCDLEQVHTLH